MERGNVLVIGNSGVGKSTLINAVLGVEKAKTGAGISGTTDKLEIYESEELPFRVIDTIGFEPSYLKELSAIHAVMQWSKRCAKEGQENNQINVIWFCVDGTSRKLFPRSILSMLRATRMWKSVPIIVVITKSYSMLEREENIAMVQAAFNSQKRYSKNLKKIVPVVASIYRLNDTAFAPPEGITELIDATNELMPEGLQAGNTDLANFKLNRKRYLAHGVVGFSAATAAVVGAVPIPIADAVILTPLEVAEINGIARIYGVANNEQSKRFLNSIVQVGTVSVAAKTAIAALKAIPGINLGASVLNAVIAASIVVSLGEGTIYAFEQVYLGKKTLEDVDWVTKLMESKLSPDFVEKVKGILDNADSMDSKSLVESVVALFAQK